MSNQKKLKIAIATRQMVMGGIEKSLIDLCNALLNIGAEVTLYLEASGGELFDVIPPQVEIVDIFKAVKNAPAALIENLKKSKISSACSLIYSYINNRFHGDPVKAWCATTHYLIEPESFYDYAFSYGSPVSFSVIFVDKILHARRKFAWIHNDVTQISLDIRKYSRIFENYDKIICVSKEARASFVKLLPQYKERSTIFYNIIDKKEIMSKSAQNIDIDRFEGKTLLTTGRLCSEKGQDIIPNIAKRLLDAGYNIRWYCVGDGEDRGKIEAQIRSLEVESHVILLGSQQNPYPFFKLADIYIQPSRHEGFGITITEAKILGLPIVTTNFAGATEQITDGETGLIVHFDEDELYNAIVSLLEDSTLCEKIKQNLKTDPKNCVSDLQELLK